jgi:hypothetical protein
MGDDNVGRYLIFIELIWDGIHKDKYPCEGEKGEIPLLSTNHKTAFI